MPPCDSQSSAAVPEILIAGEQEIESRLFCRVKQRAVLDALPSQFIRPHYVMTAQKPGQRSRSVGVEQDLHPTATVCSRELSAKARTWCTCSLLTDGNHPKNSSTVDPWSRCSNSEATPTRVPRKHHAPPSFPAFLSTALYKFQSMLSVYPYRASVRVPAPTAMPIRLRGAFRKVTRGSESLAAGRPNSQSS